jgi:molybdenum cofactor cytidylyltransferase
VLAAWIHSAVTRVVVVGRAADEPLLGRCRPFDLDLVTGAVDPPDMRSSVRLALRFIEDRYAPHAEDVWLLAPADLPHLSPQVIDTVVSAHNPERPAAIMPAYEGRRGHPLLMPWAWAAHVHRLPRGAGVNALLKQFTVRELPFSDALILDDLDTQADYSRLNGAANASPAPPTTRGASLTG